MPARAAMAPPAPSSFRSIKPPRINSAAPSTPRTCFALKEFGNIYSRIMNPTCDALERKVAALEGGVAALAVSSGQAASAMALQNLCRAGDNVVSSTDLYGGTWNLFANTLASMGIEVRFVDPADPEAFRRATDVRTRAYYAETVPNPKLQVFPIGEVAAIGRELGVPLIMDNTEAPVICRPLEHGAAVVVHSTTKYIGGHGTSIGGIIVDGGNFDWAAHRERFPTLNEPDPSYHGAVWTEAVKPLGPIAYIIRARVVLLRDIGACMSPFNAFQFIQGLETLPLRIPSTAATPARSRFISSAMAQWRASSIRPCTRTPSSGAAATLISRAAMAASWASSSRPAMGRARASSMRSSCSTTWPISAMRARSPSIRPAPRTRS